MKEDLVKSLKNDQNDEVFNNASLSSARKWFVSLLWKKKINCISTAISSVTDNTTALKKSHPAVGFTIKKMP